MARVGAEQLPARPSFIAFANISSKTHTLLWKSLVLRMILVGILSAGCRHRPAVTASAPVLPSEDYCWFAVARSPLPADSVAVRFQRAFTAVGLTGATWARNADTAWAHAGPTPLARKPAGAVFGSRAVAYQRGDSTHFRWYVSVAPPSQRWAQPDDSIAQAGATIGLCGDISRAAAVQGSAPKEPTGEEGLSVWRHRPRAPAPVKTELRGVWQHGVVGRILAM